MSLYTPLPESLILTTEQVKEFEKLQHSLIRMRTWLEDHDYRGTAVERVRVNVSKTSWLGRKKLVTAWQDQRLYRLSVLYESRERRNASYSSDAFAVNIDGVLLGNYSFDNHGYGYVADYPYPGEWTSAQDVGLRPAYIHDIVEAIDRTTTQ